ncbi:hypothetical protein ACFQWB_16805 [Paenibacillus thermoaerophilus]|uniref:Uncharacterized protein n=1 Tax=Paenibacillus thermoaerophilus TaxID=1215385 RepID=A0ABW2V8K6_9BACL|nr:hypothetical protein [Paenibacillus thermoaerophilus]
MSWDGGYNLLVLNLILLIRINSRLPGKAPVREAVERYYKEKTQR